MVFLLNVAEELAQWQSRRPLIQWSMVQFQARSPVRVMGYDEACSMHLTRGVVHNWPNDLLTEPDNIMLKNIDDLSNNGLIGTFLEKFLFINII